MSNFEKQPIFKIQHIKKKLNFGEINFEMSKFWKTLNFENKCQI